MIMQCLLSSVIIVILSSIRTPHVQVTHQLTAIFRRLNKLTDGLKRTKNKEA